MTVSFALFVLLQQKAELGIFVKFAKTNNISAV